MTAARPMEVRTQDFSEDRVATMRPSALDRAHRDDRRRRRRGTDRQVGHYSGRRPHDRASMEGSEGRPPEGRRLPGLRVHFPTTNLGCGSEAGEQSLDLAIPCVRCPRGVASPRLRLQTGGNSSLDPRWARVSYHPGPLLPAHPERNGRWHLTQPPCHSLALPGIAEKLFCLMRLEDRAESLRCEYQATLCASIPVPSAMAENGGEHR